jgi:hypothetical protein
MDTSGPGRPVPRRLMAPVVVVLLTGLWLTGQVWLFYAMFGTAMDIGCGESPTPARLVDRWNLVVTAFGVVLVAAPATIAGCARMLGLRRTAIAYATIAALLAPLAVVTIVVWRNEYS